MTLIEVLVAFVVLSVALAVIMQIFSGGLRNARIATGYSRALFLAESKLAAVGVEHPLTGGEYGGQLGVDQGWRVIVNPYDDGAGVDRSTMPVRLFEVRVQVNWTEDGRLRQIELVSLRTGARQ